MAQQIPWPLGAVRRCDAAPGALSSLLEDLRGRPGLEWVLIWDVALGTPPLDVVRCLSQRDWQVSHAGLDFGMGGLPEVLDFVSPTWMLNLDASRSTSSTSWRVSWRACLIPLAVLERCGGPRPNFETLEGSALEWGHRLIKSGVVLRYEPRLVSVPRLQAGARMPLADEIRFLRLRQSGFWARYALWRMILSGFRDPAELMKAWVRARQTAPPLASTSKFDHANGDSAPAGARVTVLIPTVDRYDYLRTVLAQLQQQSIAPCEVIVVDQTDSTRRDLTVASVPTTFPLRVIYQERPGQCSARNLGLNSAQGEYILFLDDDDEIDPKLIEKHLACLAKFGSDVSAGVAEEAGAGPLPHDFTYLRVSDVFPTNNCMIRASSLTKSGLFDLAYDRGARADGDLGMRLYLGGAVMILNPEISVFHHHAPMGGLRTHKARKVTYARSRTSLVDRHIPSATEAYLWSRYFSQRQVREEIWLRALGTLVVRGGRVRKLAKAAIGIFMMPHTLWRIRRAMAAAAEMRMVHPTIPTFAGAASVEPPPGTKRCT